MTSTAKTRLRDNPQVHLRGALIAIVSLAALLIGKSGVLSFDISAFAVLGLITSLALMFISREADEYVAALWSAGTSAAFVVAVVWLLFAPVIEGFIDGLFAIEGGMDFPVDFVSIAALTAFLIAFYWRRLRG
ncbi:MAG: hypothetical protein ABJM58_10670 [Alteripontixanthobacter sp.]